MEGWLLFLEHLISNFQLILNIAHKNIHTCCRSPLFIFTRLFEHFLFFTVIGCQIQNWHESKKSFLQSKLKGQLLNFSRPLFSLLLSTDGILAFYKEAVKVIVHILTASGIISLQALKALRTCPLILKYEWKTQDCPQLMCGGFSSVSEITAPTKSCSGKVHRKDFVVQNASSKSCLLSNLTKTITASQTIHEHLTIHHLITAA